MEFVRLRFPMSVRCMVLSCARMQKGLPPIAFWQEVHTKVVVCTDDRDKMMRGEDTFVGITLKDVRERK